MRPRPRAPPDLGSSRPVPATAVPHPSRRPVMTVLSAPAPAAGNAQLIAAALLGIATVVLLIAWAKLHPFLSLILGAAVLGIVAGLGPDKTITSFSNGVGSTVGSVGLLIALGAM